MKKLIRYGPVKSGAIGTWGEVMTSYVSFERNSIQYFYPPPFLSVHVCVMARIWAKWIMEITRFEG